MSKTFINTAIGMLITLVLVIGIVRGISAIVKWDQKVPDEFLVLDDATKDKKYDKKDFPSDRKISYTIKNIVPLINRNEYFFYGRPDENSSDNSFILAKKEGNTYKMLTGDKKGYSFKDPSFFHLSGPFQFKKELDTISIHFLSKQQYNYFIDEVDNGEEWREIIMYYKNKEKNK